MTSSTPGISFTYTIIPPPDVDPYAALHDSQSIPPSGSKTIPFPSAPPQAQSQRIPTSNPANPTNYYASASIALREAQRQLNELLTGWKDAIGDREKYKEDLGVVGYGQGKVARMMAAHKLSEKESVQPEFAIKPGERLGGGYQDEDEDDEDGVELAEIW